MMRHRTLLKPRRLASTLKRVLVSQTTYRTEVNNWKGEFDSLVYLTTRYPPPGTVKNHFAEFFLRCLHQSSAAYQNKANDLRVLEYGCGPVPIHTISFVLQAKEVVLAEYLEQNRNELKKWLSQDEKSFNWTPYVEYVVCDLEGLPKGQSVWKREETIREIVKAVVPCDIHKDPPLELTDSEGYDIVISSFCIEAGTATRDEYQEAVRKLSRLLNPGGSLFLFSGQWEHEKGVEGERKAKKENKRGYYSVGKSIFYNLPLTRELVEQALEKCGGQELVVLERDAEPESYRGIQSDLKGFLFASAKY